MNMTLSDLLAVTNLNVYNEFILKYYIFSKLILL